MSDTASKSCCFLDGNKILKLRKEVPKLSQSKLAEETNTTQWFISNLENNKSKDPSFYTVCKIAKYFNKPVEYFSRD